jgi:hypothetical protein
MAEAGLRAWIGEVERKLGTRTRVMLALAAIAIGAGGAAIYIAAEANNQAVSEADVRALQQRLEARINESGAAGGSATLTRLESELKALREQLAELKGKGATGPSGSGGATGKGTAGSTGSGKSGEGTSAPSTGPAGKLRELFERMKQQGSK